MPPEDLIRLRHMAEPTRLAIGFCQGRQRADMDADAMLRLACCTRSRSSARPRPRSRRRVALKQRPFAIVDEADSVFIDEARKQLILSVTTDEPQEAALCEQALAFERDLQEDEDLRLDRFRRSATLTDAGRDRLDAHAALLAGWWTSARAREERLTRAPSALWLNERDHHCVVADGKVRIVDGVCAVERQAGRGEVRRWRRRVTLPKEAVTADANDCGPVRGQAPKSADAACMPPLHSERPAPATLGHLNLRADGGPGAGQLARARPAAPPCSACRAATATPRADRRRARRGTWPTPSNARWPRLKNSPAGLRPPTSSLRPRMAGAIAAASAPQTWGWRCNPTQRLAQIARARLQAGSVNLPTVLDAERQSQTAFDRLAQADSGTAGALVEVCRARGGGRQGRRPVHLECLAAP